MLLLLATSPLKPRPSLAGVASRRATRPSPEKKSLPFTTLVRSQKRTRFTTETGSPTKKLKDNAAEDLIPDAYFDDQLGHASEGFEKRLAQSKIIELPYSLVENGRATVPPNGDFSELLKLFSTTVGVEVFPPYLIFRVKEIPPKPWPLTIGGLPVQFSTDTSVKESFHRGRMGRGRRALEDLDLHRKIDYEENVLRQVVRMFQETEIKIRDVYWFGGFWQVTVPDDTDFKLLPHRIASSPAFYRTISENPDPDPVALRSKAPQGVEYDDTVYTITPNALLRPGIMLSSSISEGSFKSTTSGILVVDHNGQLYITVATHGFEDDGVIYHPNPHKGSVIGRIMKSLPGTDISLAKLNPGLRYINETFRTHAEPNGIRLNGISPAYPPHLRVYDALTMENPFSGSCEGTVMALGARIVEEGDKGFVAHEWIFFENGDEPVNGSCGSPILDTEGKVVGLFRFKVEESGLCLTVSATELQERGYEICGGERSFT